VLLGNGLLIGGGLRSHINLSTSMNPSGSRKSHLPGGFRSDPVNLISTASISYSIATMIHVYRTSLIICGPARGKTAVLHNPNPNPNHTHRSNIQYERYEPLILSSHQHQTINSSSTQGKKKKRKKRETPKSSTVIPA
jgi:hypothetical protein